MNTNKFNTLLKTVNMNSDYKTVLDTNNSEFSLENIHQLLGFTTENVSAWNIEKSFDIFSKIIDLYSTETNVCFPLNSIALYSFIFTKLEEENNYPMMLKFVKKFNSLVDEDYDKLIVEVFDIYVKYNYEIINIYEKTIKNSKKIKPYIDLAINNISKAIDCYRKGNEYDDDTLIEAYKKITELYKKIGNYELAQSCISSAISIYRQYRGLDIILDEVHNKYNDLDEKDDDFGLFMEYNDLEDKIFEQDIKFSERQKHLIELNRAKLEEKNEIIAKISHSIKNLVANIIEPLEDMKNNNSNSPQIVNNALKGANIIREIVNSMNSSLKGSREDFIYDANHNNSDDAMTFEQIIIESIKTSVTNMFDGKFFKNFVSKYFSTRDNFIEAKNEWSSISKNTHIEDYLEFLETYFLKLEINVDDIKDYKIGNEKGSAIKFLILLQEIILNAVKYSAFIPKDERIIRFSMKNIDDLITLNIENNFDPEIKTKSSGLGKEIISNMSNLLKAKYKKIVDKNKYNVNLKFDNLWSH